MEPETAAAVNEHLGLAFDHLREAIMLAIAGEPTGEVGGAIGRLERFVQSGGDTSVLLEGLPPDAQAFVAEAAALFPESDEEFDTTVKEVEAEEDDLEAKRAFNPAFEGDEGDEEDDEFSGLFDDIDEDESDDDPSDAPAAF